MSRGGRGAQDVEQCQPAPHWEVTIEITFLQCHGRGGVFHGWRGKRQFLLSVLGFLPVVGILGFSTVAWSADDYLSELEAEAGKVDAELTEEPDRATGPGAVEQSVEPGGQAPRSQEKGDLASQRANFESLLKKHYFGTYGFYRKLPERSRQEVFEEYRRGVGMDKIRKKIVSRLLQH